MTQGPAGRVPVADTRLRNTAYSCVRSHAAVWGAASVREPPFRTGTH